MRILLLVLAPFFVSAQAPVESCISYEFNRIKEDTAELVLRNVFKDQLFQSLKKEFPTVDTDWAKWTTNVESYKNDEGVDKTKIKGCFDITSIYKDSSLVTSIMRVANRRFSAALKFYSKKDSDHVEEEKIDKMFTGFEEIIRADKLQKTIDEKLESET